MVRGKVDTMKSTSALNLEDLDMYQLQNLQKEMEKKGMKFGGKRMRGITSFLMSYCTVFKVFFYI